VDRGSGRLTASPHAPTTHTVNPPVAGLPGSLLACLKSEGTPTLTTNHQSVASSRETDDNYAGVIAYVGPDRRVSNCADNLQWIVQRRSGGRWRSHSFVRTRSVLLRILSPLPDDAREALESLPEVHP